MYKNHQHITLIGFKNVGKSIIGKNLATKLHLPFIDTDIQIEIYYKNKFNEVVNCRQISQQHGIEYFRSLEKIIITDLVQQPCSVVALGGGAPLLSEIQQIIKSHLLIHITAPKDAVFHRIIDNGRPAFIGANANLNNELEALWIGREKCYQQLTNISIINDGTINSAVKKIITVIKAESTWQIR